MGREEAQEILQRAISLSAAEHVEAWLQGFILAATRYANNAITQNLAKSDAVLRVRVAFGQRVGEAQVNQFDEASLRRAVERAEEMARQAAPDHEYLPPPEPPSTYPEVEAFDEETAQLTPEERAAPIRALAKRCRPAGLRAAGSFSNEASFTAVANSKGLYAYHRRTLARFAVTIMTEDSSGKAEAVHTAVRHLQPEVLEERAREKAEASRRPRDLEPGEYPVILEPPAVAELLAFMVGSMDAKAAHEGRSPFAGQEGQVLLDEKFTLRSQPDFPHCPGFPFAESGLPAPRVEWFRQGRLETLIYNRYWAQRMGRPFTGWPSNLILEPGEQSLEALIADAERGLWVSRFWYVRFIDPMRLLLTGMTRDGLFWVEGGKVRYGVKNLRFNDSPLRAFARIEALGRAQWVDEYGHQWVPALRLERFHFDSKTTF